MENRLKQLMLLAKGASQNSNCKRRKIGVVIEGIDSIYEGDRLYILGSNNASLSCKSCNREMGDCPAEHAEVNAIEKLPKDIKISGALYIWAEVPCMQCLNVIAIKTNIKQIHCLSAKSYSEEYPRVKNYGPSIVNRKAYATLLGLTITQHDREKILQAEVPSYELHRTA